MARTAAISLRVEPELKNAIEKLARDDRRTIAAYVELLLHSHAEEKGALKAGTPAPAEEEPRPAAGRGRRKA